MSVELTGTKSMPEDDPALLWGSIPARLQEEIRRELSNARLARRKHPSRATYALGCDGPLCRKAERDRQQARRERRAAAEGRELRSKPRNPQIVADDLILESFIKAFFPVADE